MFNKLNVCLHVYIVVLRFI